MKQWGKHIQWHVAPCNMPTCLLRLPAVLLVVPARPPGTWAAASNGTMQGKRSGRLKLLTLQGCRPPCKTMPPALH